MPYVSVGRFNAAWMAYNDTLRKLPQHVRQHCPLLGACPLMREPEGVDETAKWEPGQSPVAVTEEADRMIDWLLGPHPVTMMHAWVLQQKKDQ